MTKTKAAMAIMHYFYLCEHHMNQFNEINTPEAEQQRRCSTVDDFMIKRKFCSAEDCNENSVRTYFKTVYWND